MLRYSTPHTVYCDNMYRVHYKKYYNIMVSVFYIIIIVVITDKRSTVLYNMYIILVDGFVFCIVSKTRIILSNRIPHQLYHRTLLHTDRTEPL